MTDTDLYTPRAQSPAREPANTIYRDTPQPTPARFIPRALRPRLATSGPTGEPVSDGILLGLATMMVPVLVYTFVQMGHIASGGAFEQAIRAFLP